MKFGRLERGSGPQPMGEINMTPLIDVMLVLLVIFIVTAPLIGSRLALELPRADAPASAAASPHLLVEIDAEGRLHLAGEPIEAETLAMRIEAAGRSDPLTEVQLRADRSVAYGRVAELIALVQQAGLTRIGFVTEAPPGLR